MKRPSVGPFGLPVLQFWPGVPALWVLLSSFLYIFVPVLHQLTSSKNPHAIFSFCASTCKSGFSAILTLKLSSWGGAGVGVAKAACGGWRTLAGAASLLPSESQDSDSCDSCSQAHPLRRLISLTPLFVLNKQATTKTFPTSYCLIFYLFSVGFVLK